MSLKSKKTLSFFRTKNKVRRLQVSSVKVTLLLALLCCCVLTLLFWSSTRSLSAPPEPIEIPKSKQAEPNPAPIEPEPKDSNLLGRPEQPSNIVESACKLIYDGKFDSAKEIISQAHNDSGAELNETLRQLLEIINEYQDLTQNRQSAWHDTYKQQLAELEKLQAAVPQETLSADTSDVNNVAAISDANDANDIFNTLSVIAKASEFANEAQRAELLSKPFVKKVFQKVIDKAAEYELQGKWLEAYTTCYAWLQAIDPNNKAYSDYADELLDKAGIVASFQDSPCETSQERFQGIKKEMFIRAIDAMDVHYVNDIDYSQMAIKAIRRCGLLTEVMTTSFLQNLPNEGDEKSFSPPDANELSAWSAALAAVLSEVEAASSKPSEFDKDKFIEVFERILALNTATIQLPRTVLIAQFSEASLSALDPYTVMVWPRQVQDFERMMTNEFTGIGIEISRPKGLLTVSSLLPDTPAYRSGLDAGDEIVAVDGVETKDMSLICAVHKITGPKGTKVTLTIKRPGEENTRDITITRAKITVPTIRGWQRTETGKWLYMITDSSLSSVRSSSTTNNEQRTMNGIGYVRLTSFSEETPSALEKVLNELEQEGLKGLILDLRFNSGGLLDSAVGVADIFIEEGWIVRTQPGFGRTPTYKIANKKGTHPNYPLVILINSSSASASEIVAGALADQLHERAVLVGERTHGKGSVQGITHYPGGGAQLKYTMAYYHLPSGQRVKSREAVEKERRNDWGVGPDIEVKIGSDSLVMSDELRKMLSVQRDNDVLVQVGRGVDREAPKKYTVEETLAADPQLAVAVLVIKTKLIQVIGNW